MNAVLVTGDAEDSEVRALPLELRAGGLGYGAAVGTALAVRHRACAGLFDVTTLAAYRRRGLGAALTAQAASDAFAGGARCAWGRGVYERLGFELLEEWPVWVSP